MKLLELFTEHDTSLLWFQMFSTVAKYSFDTNTDDKFWPESYYFNYRESDLKTALGIDLGIP